ncbi:10987_t:CDS:2 [Ambispora gerdemannii]|uniref:10987_t:CDS:1 n=1 Tax=Ambispora gerdemannii TaxID=144530 RepID=A0A9N9FEG3_9GLOM|nr:10987_t:CDS:2 [Ambispora gerdemannii]
MDHWRFNKSVYVWRRSQSSDFERDIQKRRKSLMLHRPLTSACHAERRSADTEKYFGNGRSFVQTMAKSYKIEEHRSQMLEMHLKDVIGLIKRVENDDRSVATCFCTSYSGSIVYIRRWTQDAPKNFRFVVIAYRPFIAVAGSFSTRSILRFHRLHTHGTITVMPERSRVYSLLV